MSITDACDINTVLRYFLGMPGPLGKPVGREDAEKSAARLADRANKALSAGLRAGDVRDNWPRPGKRVKQ